MELEQPGSEQESTTDVATGQSSSDQAPEVTNIDNLEKFSFQGKEWTPQELKSAYLMQSDYTKKTQALAENQRQWEAEEQYRQNLFIDLQRVRQDPNLIQQFMQVYPRKYHTYLDAVVQSQPTQFGIQQQQNNNQQTIDPTVFQLQRQFAELQANFRTKEVDAIEANLTSKFESLAKKYPYANEEAILARADAILAKNPEFNFTDQIWDAIWKQNNEGIEKSFKGYYSRLVQEQKSANKKGSDIPKGGAIPGRGPRLPKSIKEATNMLLDSGELDNV